MRSLFLFLLFSQAIFAEDAFIPAMDSFNPNPSKENNTDMRAFIAPEIVNGVFEGTFAAPEKELGNSNLGLFSVIDSSIESTGEQGSMGEKFFLSSASADYDSPEEFNKIPDYKPVKEWTLEDISGVEEQSVEDILSSRGLPKVSMANTSLDILGLPKPNMTGYEDGLKQKQEIPEEEVKEKAIKSKFSDLFMRKQ